MGTSDDHALAAGNAQLIGELFQNCSIAIGVRDVRGHDIVHVEDNPRAAAFFHKTPEQLRGVSEAELGVPRDHIDRSIARLRVARATGKPGIVEFSLESPHGRRTLSGTVVALEHAPEERYAFVLEDVTELRALQSSMERAERLAAVGTLSASISHEIANPAMYAELHLRFAMERASAEGVSPAILDDLKTALQGVEQVTSLLQDLRSLSMDPPQASEVGEIEPALQTVVGLVRPALESTELHVRSAPVPAVRVSRGRLIQVLLNLVRNAKDAVGGRQGNIWIDVSQATPETVQIDVADDGPGLAAELRARLFEPFVTTKPMGTGLGLYVSRLLVTRAGGTIEALDREGGGLRMRVVLPTVAGESSLR